MTNLLKRDVREYSASGDELLANVSVVGGAVSDVSVSVKSFDYGVPPKQFVITWRQAMELVEIIGTLRSAMEGDRNG